ncbi:hypothetical protein HDA32_001833 [Spinactinospora alkalitolerans]|uniref:ABC-2 type transporter transmembrane domain-containing protein n=1 Tax=Spinactinospora alkalitolerans TaxID=687207 RepID=A0A852TV76_9ACTN|nr:ABC transporter permease [Spinactinospora alkalitolerans]NYE46713.1 hypothetical protein [Spinactinospora alkalitolerans]
MRRTTARYGTAIRCDLERGGIGGLDSSYPAPRTRNSRGPRPRRPPSATPAGRGLVHAVREPFEVVIGLAMPIVMVLLFGYVFGSAMAIPGEDGYREFLVPGIVGMTMLMGVGATATGVAQDTDRAVISRFPAMPMARSAPVTGRVTADMLRAVLEMAVMIVCGLLIGWRWAAGPGEGLLAVGLFLLLRFALTWVAVYLGLLVPTPAAAGMVVWPLAFPLSSLSSTFVPPRCCRTGSARSPSGTRCRPR